MDYRNERDEGPDVRDMEVGVFVLFGLVLAIIAVVWLRREATWH